MTYEIITCFIEKDTYEFLSQIGRANKKVPHDLCTLAIQNAASKIACMNNISDQNITNDLIDAITNLDESRLNNFKLNILGESKSANHDDDISDISNVSSDKYNISESSSMYDDDISLNY
jgi:hypothetical protein